MQLNLLNNFGGPFIFKEGSGSGLPHSKFEQETLYPLLSLFQPRKHCNMTGA